MKFFEDTVCQVNKKNQIVCGDAIVCERTIEYTTYILCDGIGSGVYANIAAITCANRLMELSKSGLSMRTACEMVADSMHRAREEHIPFSAFTAVRILKDGQFTVYSYESPNPVMIRSGIARALKPTFFKAGYEVVGECFGSLEHEDAILIFSDGISQAGLGRGSSLGIGSEGVAEFYNRSLLPQRKARQIPTELLHHVASFSGGNHEDDSTVVLLECRPATQLTILSGPPSHRTRDGDFVRRFMDMPGYHCICGSTTADIAGRELGLPVKLVNAGTSFGSPPEYAIEGIDMVTEGAIILNQVYNILGEPYNSFDSDSVVERLCGLMHGADVITFLVGNAINEAHDALVFKQIGIRPRHVAIRLLSEKLREMGKLVVAHYD
ncbi:MAG: hypothetical protein CVU86_00925 [Firmicutes bacterium HGW-Firmicutes-11]|nr:MAG: hypothetical protein CVV42_20825 [Candidatus Riflebacteria bacterium HGW-Riflebacteria-2]PKM85632.1 MAG: hypothetical protein CVU86_00925 [Firmicutes bacterium HGW-Firmicutes-11]